MATSPDGSSAASAVTLSVKNPQKKKNHNQYIYMAIY